MHIKTPLLSTNSKAAVYLATPAPNGEPGKNPFGSLVALYIVAEDPVSGVLVKLAGEGHVDERTLQISTTFPQHPAGARSKNSSSNCSAGRERR